MDGATVAEVASGLGFTEGPLWTGDGRLLVVSVSRGLVYEVDDGGFGELAEPGGNPTGLCRDALGDIWIAQGGGHARTSSARPTTASIQRLRGGVVEDFAAGGLTAPNDLAIGPDGLLWFTDPAGEPMSAEGTPGRLWTLDRGSGELRLRAEGLRYPNGLAFGPADGDLYVAETGLARVSRFALDGNELGPAGVHCELPRGHPDGLAFDADGGLHVAAPDAGAVFAFAPAGKLAATTDVGAASWPTNLCFGGEDRHTLYVTAARGGRVLSLPAAVAGAPLLT